MEQVCQLKNLTELTSEIDLPCFGRIEEIRGSDEAEKFFKKIEQDKLTRTYHGFYRNWKLLTSKTANLLTPQQIQVGTDGKLGFLIDNRTPRFQVAYKNKSKSLYVFGEECCPLLKDLYAEQKFDLNNLIEEISLTDTKEVNKLLNKSHANMHRDGWLLLSIPINKESTIDKKQIGTDGKLGFLIDNRTTRFKVVYKKRLNASYTLGRFKG